mmetsp:Transcript_50700/g.99318  ORF Transcript_50700/g.99318 Transcript_50700/m.99318 type:complete len:367 (-) Transcript_50700:534-1634(-)
MAESRSGCELHPVEVERINLAVVRPLRPFRSRPREYWLRFVGGARDCVKPHSADVCTRHQLGVCVTKRAAKLWFCLRFVRRDQVVARSDLVLRRSGFRFPSVSSCSERVVLPIVVPHQTFHILQSVCSGSISPKYLCARIQPVTVGRPKLLLHLHCPAQLSRLREERGVVTGPVAQVQVLGHICTLHVVRQLFCNGQGPNWQRATGSELGIVYHHPLVVDGAGVVKTEKTDPTRPVCGESVGNHSSVPGEHRRGCDLAEQLLVRDCVSRFLHHQLVRKDKVVIRTCDSPKIPWKYRTWPRRIKRKIIVFKHSQHCKESCPSVVRSKQVLEPRGHSYECAAVSGSLAELFQITDIPLVDIERFVNNR